MRQTNAGSRITDDSLARLTSTAAKLVASFVVAVITARYLGVEGKGTFSTLLSVAMLLTYTCSLGLGEASIILINRGEVPLQRAISGSILPVLFASLAGIPVLVAAALVGEWKIWDAVASAALLVMVGSLVYLLTGIEDSRFGIRFTSRVAIVSSGTTLSFTILLVVVLGAGIGGAISAAVVGAIVSLVMLLRTLVGSGVRIRPTFDPSFLRRGLSVGAALGAAHLLNALAQRVDLIVVYWLLGEADAGVYSISLTIGQISSYAALALAYAAFPRVAAAGSEWSVLSLLASRMAVLIGAISAIGLAVVVPLIVPVLFGRDFEDAVGISLILLLGGIVWGVVGTLARGLAGGDRARSYLKVFAVTLILMVGLDLLMIPTLGLLGAAMASNLAICGGLFVAFRSYRRLGLQVGIGDLIPRRGDVHRLSTQVRSLLQKE